jgi:hypothetical protein
VAPPLAGAQGIEKGGERRMIDAFAAEGCQDALTRGKGWHSEKFLSLVETI